MSRVLLDAGKRAEHAFYLNKMSVSIHSVEELCYLLHEETIFVDMGMFTEKLVRWLEEECHMKELADALRRILKSGGSVAALASTILDAVGMYAPEEVEKVEHFLKMNSSLNERDRRKNMGDYLAEKKRYEAAIREYASLLKRQPESEKEFRGTLLHNMGCCYGNLFLFPQAQDCFSRAYALTGSRESRGKYLAALRLQMSEEKYIAFIAANADAYYDVSMDVEKAVEEGTAKWKGSEKYQSLLRMDREKEEDPEGFARQMHALTRQLKEKYRGMMEEN